MLYLAPMEHNVYDNCFGPSTVRMMKNDGGEAECEENTEPSRVDTNGTDEEDQKT